MAYVGFKLGTQEALDELLKKGASANAVEGSFYLTSDTHRLYIGNADGSLSPVNQGVLSVAAVADLPAASTAEQTGGFYYVKEGNILCVATGGKWIQINSVKTIQDVSNTYTTVGADAVRMTTQVKVGVDVDSADKKSASVTFKGQDGAHVAIGTNANEITISSDTYTIEANEDADTQKVTLDLVSSNSTVENATVELKAGDNVAISVDEDGAVVIDSSYTNTDTDTSLRTLTAGTYTADDTAHQSGFSITAISVKKNVVTGVDGASIPAVAYFDPAITIGVDEDAKKTVKFVNGVAALDVFTKEELQSTLTSLNAMTYKGTIGSNGSAGTGVSLADNGGVNGVTLDGEPVSCSIGDTFLAEEDVKVNGVVVVPKGSLLIAKGTEENGIITSDLSFDTVANSADTDTTYTFESDTNLNGVLLKQNAGGSVSYQGSLTVKGETREDGAASVNVTKTSAANAKDVVLVVKHDTVEAPEETAQEAVNYRVNTATSFKAVTGVETDATGHLVGFETTELKLGTVKATESYNVVVTTDTTDTTLQTATVTGTTNISSTVNGGTVVVAGDSAAFDLQSSSLTLSKMTGENKNGIRVEMAWGSF